ncbi:MAG: hypothetical protein KC415_02440 [Anaerolineales bacterium]|nr:hypothetical protein [Anaerolineales bacterium]MCB8992008.1 hypothetical protein [Ardenticatenaceae bacterium]MCB9004594.1 hypothetical protein [Ardenticatenaceae bacterium]
MNVGMLWLDADGKRPLEEKVQRAADYYQEKYGRLPNLCLVNTSTVDDERKVGKILVQPVNTILPNHFWLGVEPS